MSVLFRRGPHTAYQPPIVIAWVLVCALLGMAVAAPVANAQAEQGKGQSLTVQVVNGTPQGSSVAGIQLTVFRAAGDQVDVSGTGVTDDRGTFSWSVLGGGVGTQYVVSTTYQGVLYKTEPLALPASVTLRVYDAGTDDTKVRISNMGMVIIDVDAPTQRIRILETLTLTNSGDRSFVPSTGGPRGAMGLLRFSLPEGAGNVSPDPVLQAREIIQVDKGFATDMPLPPGETSVSYTYEVAYGALSESGYALLKKTMPYPVEMMRLLSVPGEFTIESPQLSAKGTAQIAERVYRQYEGGGLPVRSEVNVELRNLPLVLPALRPGNPWLQGAVGLLLVSAVLLPVVYKRRYFPASRLGLLAPFAPDDVMEETEPQGGPGETASGEDRRLVRRLKRKNEGLEV